MQAALSRPFFFSLLLLSGLALPAPATPPQGAETTIARLVPEDATIFVRATSIDALDKFMRDMLRATDPGELEAFEVRDFVKGMQVPGDLALVDGTKPLALAVSLNLQGPPVITSIVPVSDAAAYRASVTGATATELEGYVGVSSAASYAARGGPHPLAVGLPDGVVAVRLDLEAIFEMYAEMIDQGLTMLEQVAAMSAGQTGGMDVGPMIDWYISGIEDFIDSADSLDAGLATHGDEVESSFVLKTFPDSPLAKLGGSGETGVAKLAACVDSNDSMVFLGGMDFAGTMEHMKGLLDSALGVYPEPMRAQFGNMMKAFEGVYPLLGTAFAGSGGFDAKGIRFAYFIESKDPAKLIASYGQALATLAGPTGLFAMEGPVTEKRGEIDVTRFQVRITEEGLRLMTEDVEEVDAEQGAQMRKMMEAIYGKEGMRFAMSGKGERVAFTIGGDDAFLDSTLRRLTATGTAAGPMQPVLGRVAGANPCLVFRMDLPVLFREVLTLMPSIMPMPTDKPIPDLTGISAPMLFWGGIRGAEWSGGVSFDLKKFAAFIAAMEG